jgi:dihydrofolate reductase
MGKVVAIDHLTLDGVMQGPGRVDEDTRDGFQYGGWALPRGDAALGSKMGEAMGSNFAFLFGRRTYEDLLAHWNAQGGPFKDALNNTPKFVASRSATTELDWPNSTLLSGEAVVDRVAELKQAGGVNLVIMGSGELTRSLIPASLVDEYLLMIHPIVLGCGRRLFTDGLEVALTLIDATPTPTGVVIASYQAGPAA